MPLNETEEGSMARLEDRIEIANPQQPHCATMLLLDTSGSMDGERIDQINEGLKLLVDELQRDDFASKRVDLAVISFGEGVELKHDFSSPVDFTPPTLTASGLTPMGAALLKGMDVLEGRKQEYKQYGTDYYRPWLFLFTDGAPTDMSPGDTMWNEVVRRIHDGVAQKKFLFFAIGTQDADFNVLRKIAPPLPLDATYQNVIKIKEGKFREFFQWVSKSQTAVTSGPVGQQRQLPPPTTWIAPT